MNGLELAIKMEVDGEIYYAEQAQLNMENSLGIVFLMLARDERIHAHILRSKSNRVAVELRDNDTFGESMSIFRELKDFSHTFKNNPDQMDVYIAALENEKKSIDFYQALLNESTEQADRELFEFLIQQEREHYRILEDMVILINRPKEWVESAEFGLREDY